MKCITIKPEFAEKIAAGEKTIENRTWAPRYRGLIGIHRGGRNGAIIATANLSEIISPAEALQRFPSQKPHIFGPMCWILTEIEKIQPIPCKGRLSLWNFQEKEVK